MQKKKVLCLASHYLPGFKGGGPVRSLFSICQWLRDEYDFMVVTRDRDLGDTVPYGQCGSGHWHTVDGIPVWYLSKPYWSPRQIRLVVLESKPDLLYFQSFLDPELTIAPLALRRMGLIPKKIPSLLAPRGEFSPGALSLKASQKRRFIHAAQIVGLYSDVMWHATGKDEEQLIRTWWGQNAAIAVAENLPARVISDDQEERVSKQSGMLRAIFLSRISRKKNLRGALEVLKGVKAEVYFDIYGPLEDKKYWREGETIIDGLPKNIHARYAGVVAPEGVHRTLTQYELLLLRTFGNNFGHVIVEALVAGCPVVLSDQTPWRNLQLKKVGFDLPLGRDDQFVKAIEQFAAMNEQEFRPWARRARDLGLCYSQNADSVRATRAMLDRAMNRTRHPTEEATGDTAV
jgi:glycosyltransferase involved in cell wall biosynthesis